MSKRVSGPPRRPRNPVAKAVRSPVYRMRVVPDKRWKERLRGEPVEPEPLEAEQDEQKEQEKE